MVTITDSAVIAIKDVLENQDNKEQRLRIYIAGMSCSGVAYGLSLDDQMSEDDKAEEVSGIQIVYDGSIEKTVEPLVINYIDDGVRKGFVVEDPTADHCGGGCAGCH